MYVQKFESAVAVALAPLPEDTENRGREGLVEFDQSDVAPVDPLPGEQPFDRGNRTDPHPRWIAACGRPAHEPTRRLQPQLGEPVFCHQEACGCAVILLARVAHSDNAAFERPECREAPDRGVGAMTLLMGEAECVASILRNRIGEAFIVDPPPPTTPN